MELFDYLGGRLDEQAVLTIEQHLAGCNDCSSLVELVRRLKAESEDERFNIEARHPDTSELATFFYGKSPRSRSAATAAHLALCRECAGQLALYVQAEKTASVYDPSRHKTEPVPSAAWDRIRDWRESSFAGRKPDREWTSPQSLIRLSQVLSQRKDELRDLANSALKRGDAGAEPFPDEKGSVSDRLVPVIIVDRSAQFRGVEMFERSTGHHGASVLKHPDKSHRFDNRQFHALLDFGEQSFIVVSDFVRRDKVRLQRVTSPEGRLRRADYFIVED
jgi:hypothetical protein